MERVLVYRFALNSRPDGDDSAAGSDRHSANGFRPALCNISARSAQVACWPFTG
jgi:hypothetical protein